MSATREHKRSATDSSNPLQQAGVLKHVLDYVGPGHCCFVGEVDWLWRGLYLRVASRETMYSAVCGSPSRVRLAATRGLDCTTQAFMSFAGRYADVATLKAAQELGVDFTIGVSAIEGAVRCNNLTVVQFRDQGCYWSNHAFGDAAGRGDFALCEYLYDNDCDWSTLREFEAAAREGKAGMLRWLYEHDCPWDEDRIHTCVAEGGSVDAMMFLQEEGIVHDELLTEMLNVAGACNKLAAAQWLKQQGAEWPAMLKWEGWRGESTWSGEVLTWARAEGCTSPTE
jgi:hypothetical protein